MARTTAATTTDPGAPAAGQLIPEEAGRWLGDLFEEHGRMVYGVCRVLLRDPQDAEDASQQTFLSAHRSLLAGTRPRDPAAWLGAIARNECRDRIRARANVPLALVGDPAASVQLEEVSSRREEIEALSAALAELPHQQREAIVLREFYGLSYDEVRAALGVSDAAVESLIFRARKRLQKELRPARVASGALVLPLALHDSLAHAIPGFGGAQRAGILAKLAGAPIAAKLAAATLAVTVAGVAGSAAVQRHGSHSHRFRVESTPGVAQKSPSAPAGPAVADPVSTLGSLQAASDHLVHVAQGPRHHDDPQDGGAGTHEANQGDQDEQTVIPAGDQDQNSDANETDDASASPTEDAGNADAADSGGNERNASSGGDGNAADSSGDGDG